MNTNNDKMNIELKVLSERVKKNEEILDLNLKSYRNYGLIIVAMLSFIGFIYVSITIQNIVSKTTEDKLDKILTEQYVDSKIRFNLK